MSSCGIRSRSSADDDRSAAAPAAGRSPVLTKLVEVVRPEFQAALIRIDADQCSLEAAAQSRTASGAAGPSSFATPITTAGCCRADRRSMTAAPRPVPSAEVERWTAPMRSTCASCRCSYASRSPTRFNSATTNVAYG